MKLNLTRENFAIAGTLVCFGTGFAGATAGIVLVGLLGGAGSILGGTAVGYLLSLNKYRVNQEEITRREGLLRDRQAKIDAQAGKLAAAQHRIAEFESKLEFWNSLGTESHRMQGRIVELEEGLTQAKSQLAAQERRISDLEKEVQRLQALNSKQAEEISGYKAERARTEEIVGLRLENQYLQESQEFAAEVAELNRCLETLTSENARLEGELVRVRGLAKEALESQATVAAKALEAEADHEDDILELHQGLTSEFGRERDRLERAWRSTSELNRRISRFPSGDRASIRANQFLDGMEFFLGKPITRAGILTGQTQDVISFEVVGLAATAAIVKECQSVFDANHHNLEFFPGLVNAEFSSSNENHSTVIATISHGTGAEIRQEKAAKAQEAAKAKAIAAKALADAKAKERAQKDLEEVRSLFIPATDFEAAWTLLLVKPSVRISGGTGSGKGITTSAILSLWGRDAVVELHDPKESSLVNHWAMAAKSKGKKECTAAVSELDDFVQSREDGDAPKDWKLVAVFDEIDKTIPKSEAQKLLSLTKGIRHEGVKIIAVGQNANVGKLGWEWSDMDQFVIFACGQSALDLIKKHPSLESHKPTQKQAIEEYTRIHAHVDSVNQERGVGFDHPDAMRVALVVSSTIKGGFTWVELPNPTQLIHPNYVTQRPGVETRQDPKDPTAENRVLAGQDPRPNCPICGGFHQVTRKDGRIYCSTSKRKVKPV